jgi:single-stranded-DNA-specific exonuclease
MRVIDSRRRPGLSRLIKAAGLTNEKIKSENIAYILVPHLNAAGRLQDARVGVELLISRDERKIEESVSILIKNNCERKRIQEEAFLKCREIINAELSGDLFYVIAPKDVHEGIAGSVAGKIKEELGRPAIIVTESSEDGLLKGTGRSIDGVNLYELLKKHDELFLKFGGHAGACGFLMESRNLDELRTRLNREMEALYRENSDLFNLGLHVDLVIKEEDIDLSLAMELEKLLLSGAANDRPLFQIKASGADDVNFMEVRGRLHVAFFGLGAPRKKGALHPVHGKPRTTANFLLKDESFDLAGYPDVNRLETERAKFSLY